MNPTLEVRLASLRASLNALALAVDDNLRAVLLRLTCDQMIASNSPLRNIDELARNTRETCMLFVVRQRPFAHDLKYAMAVLRVGHDYERVNELAVELSRRTDRLMGSQLQDIVQDMTGVMADILKLHELVRKPWQSQSKETNGAANRDEVAALAASINQHISTIQNDIIESLASGNRGENSETFVELVLACRHIKRIANLMEAIPEELHVFDLLPRE